MVIAGLVSNTQGANDHRPCITERVNAYFACVVDWGCILRRLMLSVSSFVGSARLCPSSLGGGTCEPVTFTDPRLRAAAATGAVRGAECLLCRSRPADGACLVFVCSSVPVCA